MKNRVREIIQQVEQRKSVKAKSFISDDRNPPNGPSDLLMAEHAKLHLATKSIKLESIGKLMKMNFIFQQFIVKEFRSDLFCTFLFSAILFIAGLTSIESSHQIELIWAVSAFALGALEFSLCNYSSKLFLNHLIKRFFKEVGQNKMIKWVNFSFNFQPKRCVQVSLRNRFDAGLARVAYSPQFAGQLFPGHSGLIGSFPQDPTSSFGCLLHFRSPAHQLQQIWMFRHVQGAEIIEGVQAVSGPLRACSALPESLSASQHYAQLGPKCAARVFFE